MHASPKRSHFHNCEACSRSMLHLAGLELRGTLRLEMLAAASSLRKKSFSPAACCDCNVL